MRGSDEEALGRSDGEVLQEDVDFTFSQSLLTVT